MSLISHLAAAVDAWKAETRRRVEDRRVFVETEFLPAALEVTTTPPSPVGRAILWTVILASFTALVWAFVSEVDTVAVAEGRLIPAGRLRTVEPADAGIVRLIAVKEGQRVRAGQVLIVLDPTVAEADAQSARTELSTASLTRARAAALLAYAAGRPAVVVAPLGADQAAIAAERQLVAARVSEFGARRGALEQRLAGARASARMAMANIVKLEQTLPLAAQQVQAQETLAAQGYGARLRLLQERERFVALTQELEAERARYDEAQAQVAALQRDAAQALEEFRGRAAQEQAEAEGVVSTRGDQVRKADQREALQTLVAPVGGIVQEITVNTLGEIADAGKPLVTIVPEDEPLIVEALILGKDIGFVHRGDKVVIKLEAYPFTRYGTLTGRLDRISPDAIVDERRGLVFPARVTLTRHNLSVDGRRIPLSAGMSAVAEIVTGRRRVIEFLWSPIARTVSEAGRER